MLANIFFTLLYVYLAGWGAWMSVLMMSARQGDRMNIWMAVNALLFVGLAAIAIGNIWAHHLLY